MLNRLRALFQSKPVTAKGREAYAALIAPQNLGTALEICALSDDFSGRFEAMSLLIACYLKGIEDRPEVERALVGEFVADIDRSFRENSLGDATVKRHATNHAAALYGRLRAYEGMLADQSGGLETLQRNLYGDAPTPKQATALPQVLPQIVDLVGRVYDR